MKKIYSILILATLVLTVNGNAQSFPWNNHSKGSKSSVYSQGNLTRNFFTSAGVKLFCRATTIHFSLLLIVIC